MFVRELMVSCALVMSLAGVSHADEVDPEAHLEVEVQHRGEAVPAALVQLRTSEGRQELIAHDGLGRFDIAPYTAWTVRVQAGSCLAGEQTGLAGASGSAVAVELASIRESVVRIEVTDTEGHVVPDAMVDFAGGESGCRPDGTQRVDARGMGAWTLGAGTYKVMIATPGETPWEAELEVPSGSVQVVRAVIGDAQATSQARL